MRLNLLHPCALSAFLFSFSINSNAQDLLQLEEQVANLKAQETAAIEEQESFDIEQAEFEKMRMQLIQREREILGSTFPSEVENSMGETNSNLTPQATNVNLPNETSQTLKAALNHEESTPQLKRKISENNQEIAALRAELQDLRNKLLVAENEIERLSKSEAVHPNEPTSSKAFTKTKASEGTVIFSTAKQRETDITEDESSTIVTVVADSGALRTAPNTTSSIIMEVDSGARLTVDDRRGDWFRISTSSGMRAWISATEVAFGPTNSASPSATVKIRPSAQEQYAEEERAFQLLKNR